MMTAAANAPRRALAPMAVVLAVSIASGGAMLMAGGLPAGAGLGPIWQGGPSQPAATAPQQPQQPGSSAAASGAGEPSEPSVDPEEDPQVAVLGEATASSQSRDDDRAANLSTAAKALDGTVIEPGAELSLNDVMGRLGAAAAFRIAPEAADGHTGSTRGGGVCQVASALYVAAVRADLDVTERHAHDEACDFIAAGLDAEIDFTSKDLKLRNAGADPVRISATAQGQSVRIQVLGTPRGDGASFDVIATPDSGADSSAYTVTTQKVEYLDGSVVGKEPLSTDAYRVNATGFISDAGTATSTK